jgi:hypothetical protein
MKIWYYSNQVTRHIKDHQGSYQGSSRHNRLPWTDFACRLSWANPWQNEGCRSLLPQHTQKRRKPYSFRRENCMVISKHMETISRSSRSSIISSLIIYGHPTNPSLWRWLKYQFPSVYIYIYYVYGRPRPWRSASQAIALWNSVLFPHLWKQDLKWFELIALCLGLSKALMQFGLGLAAQIEDSLHWTDTDQALGNFSRWGSVRFLLAWMASAGLVGFFNALQNAWSTVQAQRGW